MISENEKSRRGSNPKVATASAYIATRLLLISGYASFGSAVEACVSRTSKLSTTVASAPVQESPTYLISGRAVAEKDYSTLRSVQRFREIDKGINTLKTK